MTVFQKIVDRLINFLTAVAGVVLVGMIGLTTADIILSLVWRPITGTYELTGYFGAVVTAFTIAYTQVKKGHIAVDILASSYSRGKRRVVDAINSLVCLAFFGLIAWQLTDKAWQLRAAGEVTETLRIIYYPFTLCVALGSAVMALALFLDFIKALFPAGEATS